jgi:hypothetical protein
VTRLPSGPDEVGQDATFNWVAVDLRGRYFLLDSVTVNGNVLLTGGLYPTISDSVYVDLNVKYAR